MQRSGERVEGPTPAGGVAYVAWFFDADGVPVATADLAVSMEIHELDGDGQVILRTYGECAPESPGL